GLRSEANYPYTATSDETCNTVKTTPPLVASQNQRLCRSACKQRAVLLEWSVHWRVWNRVGLWCCYCRVWVHENRAGYSFERRSLWDCHVEIEQDRISTLSDEIINDIMGVYRQKNVEHVYINRLSKYI
ncbi:hypothetical protein LINPERPRIM_LOCUS3314, partial [Linum perenne]